jgi:hypothetical protein
MYKDVQRCTNSVEFTHCTSSQTGDIPSDLMFYTSTCCSWCYASSEQTHQLLDCRDCTVENSSTNPLNCTASGLTLTLRVIHTSYQVLRCQHSFSKHAHYRTKAQNHPPPKKRTQLCMSQRFITPPSSS